MEDSDLALPLLELLRSFSLSHMERCCSSMNSSNSNSNAAISHFIHLLSQVTLRCSHATLLLRLSSVWEALLEGPHSREVVLQQSACLNAGYHLFQQSLLTINELLAEVPYISKTPLTIDNVGCGGH